MTPIFTSISLFTITLTLTLIQFTHANSEGDALYTLKRSLTDPDNVLQSWDPTLVSPCTWFHVTCNQDNRVTRVYSFCLTNFFCFWFIVFVQWLIKLSGEKWLICSFLDCCVWCFSLIVIIDLDVVFGFLREIIVKFVCFLWLLYVTICGSRSSLLLFLGLRVMLLIQICFILV